MPFELIEEVKKHPVPAALIAGGIVLGFMWISGAFSSSGASPTTTGGLDPATAQLYAQSEAIQAQQQGQTQQLTAQQNLATTQAGYGLSLAQIQANAAITQSNTAASVQVAGINATTAQTNTAASVAMAQISSDAQTAQLSVAAQLQAAQDQIGVTTASINASLAGLQDTNATTVAIASLTAGEQEQIAQITGNTQIALSNNQTQSFIAASNNQTQATIAGTNASASVAKGSQTAGLESQGLGIAGMLGAAALFSDMRLKENVRYHSTRNGVRLYEYSFRGQPERHLGVLAHEHPEFAELDVSGYLKVNYGQLSEHMVAVSRQRKRG
jgi:hypothetical protein